MAKFKFQLQGVLRYREHIERQKMLTVARLEVERRAGERVISDYQSMIRSGKDDLRKALAPASDAQGHSAPINPVSARLQAAASLHLQLKAQRAALGLAGVLKRLGDARADLAKAATARRGMEKLKEHRFDSWREDESKREGAMLDEIGTMGAARRVQVSSGTESQRNQP
ncbi:MAG: flagellar FliJ family protein [Phycisphaerales bacterium]